MSKSALAVSESTNQKLQKTKPRYTENENKTIFESWWNPQKRRELATRLGREMSALRSQFCRLLKEKGLSNQDYYDMMQSKYSGDAAGMIRKRARDLKPIDRTILEVFCKHQALGNSRTLACEELQKKLGTQFTAAALKLRFYRLIKTLQYQDDDLLRIGKTVLGEPLRITPAETETAYPEIKVEIPAVKQLDTPAIPLAVAPSVPTLVPAPAPTISGSDDSFLYQLSAVPATVKSLDERVVKLEENQRHQLDLRGFIEHLLAVERDIKREDKLMEEIQKLLTENESIRLMMEKDRDRLKKREEELSEVYNILNTMLSDFMRLESVSKLASLGDFMHRLEVTVDQFGNVLRSRRVMQ